MIGLLQLGQSIRGKSIEGSIEPARTGCVGTFTQAGGWLGPPAEKFQTRTLENHKGAAPGTNATRRREML